MHGAKRFAYIGPNVWLTDECWNQVSAALVHARDDVPSFFRVHCPHQNWRNDSDSEFFLWTRKELTTHNRLVHVPFDEFASDRGLPKGNTLGEAVAFRFHLPGMSRYKGLLDKAVRRSAAGSC